MKKIVVLSPGLSLPRYIKRVKTFVDAGFKVDVYGFERGEFQNIEEYPEEVNIYNLGQLEDGRGYLSNLIAHKQKMLPIINKYNSSDVIFYAFGYIPAFLLLVYGRQPYLYEISDLVYGTFRQSILRFPFKMIDKIIVKKSLYTVMTSSGFYDYLFPKHDRKNVIIQPNRLDVLFRNKERFVSNVSDTITFGFVGYIRYPNTIFRFASIVGQYFPQYKFYFYGDSFYRDQAIAIADKYSNVEFFGKYKNPDDLNKIYESIDVIVSCYDTITYNEQVAEPNKLYESLFYCKPIIVSPNTFIAKRVKEIGCGYVIDATNDKNIINFIETINKDEINKIMAKEYDLELSEIIDDPYTIVSKILNIKI